MEETEQKELCRQLGTLDTSLVFLVLLTVATFVSWKATAVQREGLCRILLGEETQMPDVFPMRLAVSAVVVGALVYFFRLALDNQQAAAEQGPVVRRSAQMNAWASFLVLAAALIRLYDLNFIRRCAPVQGAAAEEALPD